MPEHVEAQTRNEHVEAAASNPLRNELYVLGQGLSRVGTVISKDAVQAWENPGSTGAAMVTSGAVAAGIGYLMSARGLTGVFGGGLATAAGLSFLAEGVRPWTQAMSEAWNAKSQQDLDMAANKFGNRTGHFVFDATVMTPTAVAGMYAGGRLAAARRARSTTGTAAVAELGLTPAAEAFKPEGALIKPVEAAEGIVAKPGERVRPYRFIQLDPAAQKIPRFDYGVEVSDPRLLNGQRNLDHHRSTDTSATLSASEQALKLAAHELPKPGSVLATIRPDADSVTAMAVLANRLEGRPINTRLVEEIGKRDRISGYRKPPPDDLRDLLDAMHTNVRGPLEFHRKVWFAKDVLDGTVNPELVVKLADRARASSRSLHNHLDETAKVEMIVPNKLALVKADSSAAINRGYEYGSVVVLQNQNQHFNRFTVASMNGAEESRYMGWALRELQKIEPGWGGRSSIFGSPQDRSTSLTPEQVISVVKKYIDPPPLKRTYYDIVDFLRTSRPYTWVARPS